MAAPVPSSVASTSGYGGGKQVEVREIEILAEESEPINELYLQPKHRLSKPHQYFPFDLFGAKSSKAILERGEELGLHPDVVRELQYVRGHCMMPPYPWGQVMYRSFIKGNIIQGDVPGDFAELGIGQGGTSVFFARLAKQYGRKFLAVDSFEGLPEPDMTKDNHYFVEGDYKPKENVDQLQQFLDWKKDFDIDDVMHVEKCFFKDLVIPDKFEKFAFVHMDSDLYDSVYDSLEKVWDKVSEGGCIAIDDFFHHAQGPARAVSDFFRERGNPDGQPPLLYVVPTYAVLIVKGRSAFIRTPSASSSGQPGGRQGVMHSPRALDGNYYSFKLVRSCQPFIRAVEDCVRNATEASKQAGLDEASQQAIDRSRINAQAFLEFLKYPDNASRSGSDILRYLWPLEDQWDISQGKLNGMPGQERNTIEIVI